MTLTGVLQGQVPIECKRLFPNYEHHRQILKDSVRQQLEKDGKRLLKLRVLADGWVADWEEMGAGQNSFTSGLHQVSISAIGTKFEPVDLTLWDDEREFKHEFKPEQDIEFKKDRQILASSIPKPEPDQHPRMSMAEALRPGDPLDTPRHLPRHHLYDDHVDPDNLHRVGVPPATSILSQELQSPSRPELLTEEYEVLLPIDSGPLLPRTPTGPRGTHDASYPYIPRRPLIFQRENAPYSASNHRYIRSDQPGSLQLQRLTPSRSAARGVHRTRLTSLRGRAERRGYREEYADDRRRGRHEDGRLTRMEERRGYREDDVGYTRYGERRRTSRTERDERRGYRNGDDRGYDRREDDRLTRRERDERRGDREEEGDRHESRREDARRRRRGLSPDDQSRPSARALEGQESVYRRTLERRGWHGTEWSETNVGSTSYSVDRQDQSMQIDEPAIPQQSRFDFGDHPTVPPFDNAAETLFIAERPTSPDMDHDMPEEHAMEESTVLDAQNIPPTMKTSVLAKEPEEEDEEASSSSSSSAASSSEAEDSEKPNPPPTRNRPQQSHLPPKGAGAADLLASINFESVKDILHESTPVSAPTPGLIPRPEPQIFRRSVDGKPPIIRTAKHSTSTSPQYPPRPAEQNAKASSSSNKRAYASIDLNPDLDSDSSHNFKVGLTDREDLKANPNPKVDAKTKTRPKGKTREKEKAPPRLSMQYRHAETVKLPKPDYARARRLLAPPGNTDSSNGKLSMFSKPLACVSMPGDVQFIRDDERVRVEGWSLPAPARPKGGDGKKSAYVVTDACLLGDGNIVMVHETGPHPASIIRIPDDYDDVPSRHDLSHALVPATIQRRGILSSVCALDSQRFFTGCMDKRVLLWDVHDLDDDAAEVSVEALDIAHAASVRALAYSASRSWLISAAGAKLAVTDVSTGQAVIKAGKQKWASNDVFNVHFHSRDPNMLLVETGDLDKQARIYDLRKLQKIELAPERLIGSTETGAISQYVRGDWAKSLVVRPSSLNMVKVWDTRQPDKPLSVHTLSHTVTHCIFIDDCRTIAATGEHFVTFLDARV